MAVDKGLVGGSTVLMLLSLLAEKIVMAMKSSRRSAPEVRMCSSLKKVHCILCFIAWKARIW